MQESGINLLDQAFEQVTDAQIHAFALKTGKQRMDSTQRTGLTGLLGETSHEGSRLV